MSELRKWFKGWCSENKNKKRVEGEEIKVKEESVSFKIFEMK